MVGDNMKKYALVQDGKIIKFKTIQDDDTVIEPKLLAHDYLIVEEAPLPDFDPKTQRIIDSYEIEAERVVRVWTVENKTLEEIEAEQGGGEI